MVAQLAGRKKMMAKKFSELRSKLSPAAQERAEAKLVEQPSIAKIEKRTDMYLSTLRSHIQAMGGELDIIARFPDGVVKINNFTDLGTAG